MSPEVAVAVITGACTAVPATVAALAAWRRASKAHQEMQGNGHGTHTEMLESILRQQGADAATLRAVAERQQLHELNRQIHLPEGGQR